LQYSESYSKILLQGPQFSLSTKQPLMPDGSAHNPGPGTYNYTKDFDGPKYSIQARTNKAKENQDNPAPGQYTSISPEITKNSAPKYSMGLRPS
jgi:hypothetical protein